MLQGSSSIGEAKIQGEYNRRNDCVTTKILLVNFQEPDADRLRTLGFEVDRGYYSNAVASQNTGAISTEEIYSFLPDGIEKYGIVVVNLDYNTVVETEFRPKREHVDKAFRTDFNRYWNNIGILIIFYGDYDYDDLSTLGIFHAKFSKRNQESAQLKCLVDGGTNFRKVLIEIKNQFLPGAKAIALKDGAIAGQTWEIRRVYEDTKNNLVACYYNKATNPQEEAPRFIILPQTKDNIVVVEMLLRELAKMYPDRLPELEAQSWKEDNSYYPKRLVEYDRKLLEYKKKLKQLITEVSKRKNELRENSEVLKSILYLIDDELRKNVTEVLRRLWSLDVHDIVQSKQKDSYNDILIEHGSRKILATIHGTKNPHPSPKLIAQVWQHLHHSGLGQGVEPALIVNHDADVDPKDRMAAYVDGYEELLDGIIFIDTRVLFELTVGVIDKVISHEHAKQILFQKGRVDFSLGK